MTLQSIALPAYLALFCLAAFVPAAEAAAKRTVHNFKARANGGKDVALASYKGKVLLIVNTASRCGFTKQYAGLETVYEKYRAKGFEVLAFPANNFMGQEPGTDEEIAKFCSLKYDASFPLFSKVSVKGSDIHPLYAYLTQDTAFPGEIKWNFNKFLIGPDGKVVARFESKVEPTSAEVTAAIEKLLANK